MKRSKRLKKGIESLDKQIGIHLEKLKEAEESGDEYLMNYYRKELEGIKETKLEKKRLLEKVKNLVLVL